MQVGDYFNRPVLTGWDGPLYDDATYVVEGFTAYGTPIARNLSTNEVEECGGRVINVHRMPSVPITMDNKGYGRNATIFALLMFLIPLIMVCTQLGGGTVLASLKLLMILVGLLVFSVVMGVGTIMVFSFKG